MDPAVRCASSGRYYGPRFWRQLVNPIACQNGLAAFCVGPERGPIAFFLVGLVGNGSFYDQNKRRASTCSCGMKMLHELRAIVEGQKWIVQSNFWDPGDPPEEYLFDAWLRGRSHGDSVAVAAKAGGNPENIDFGDGLRLPAVVFVAERGFLHGNSAA